MNKTILIIYVGVKNYPIDKINEFMGNIAESVMEFNPDIAHYVFPNFESNNFKVECVNPVFVTAEGYENILLKIESVKENLDTMFTSAIKKLKNEKE